VADVVDVVDLVDEVDVVDEVDLGGPSFVSTEVH